MISHWTEKGIPLPVKKLSVACLGLCLSFGPLALHAQQNQQDNVQDQTNNAPPDGRMQAPQDSPIQGQQSSW